MTSFTSPKLRGHSIDLRNIGDMSEATGEGKLCRAVLGFVTEGIYPDERVVTAKFAPVALTRELELISKAREQVEVRIP